MYGLLAIFLLAFSAVFHAGAMVGVRRLVTCRFSSQTRAKSPLPLHLAALRWSAGMVGWYLAGSIIFTVAMLGRGEMVVDEVSMRVHVSPSGPAARAGIQDRDRIVSVGGEAVTSWDQLKLLVAKHPDEDIPVEVEREGQPRTITVRPEGNPGKMLVGPWTETKDVSIGRAIATGLVQPAKIVATTYRSLARSFSGAEKAELSGPVGIVRETSSATKQGLSTGLTLAGLLGSYAMPYVALGMGIYELLSRRRKNVTPPET